jgi:GNAT superfamily N-acetyltransferase
MEGAVLRVEALTLETFDAWKELFDACASGCFCRYWHFEGTKNDWLARLASAPETNAAEQQGRLAEEHASAWGLVAFEGDVAVGWLKLAWRSAVPKLRRLGVYRALDLGADDGVVSVACLLVRPTARRRGVARALLEGAVIAARGAGARVIEAYPHRRDEALRDEELWMGPLALFEEQGFEKVTGDVYPVLRRMLVR